MSEENSTLVAKMLATGILSVAAWCELSNYGIHVSWHACLVAILCTRFVLRATAADK